MTKTIIAAAILLAGGTATATAGQTLLDELIPAAGEQVAAESITRIVDEANITHLLGTPWEQALNDAANNARRNDAINVTGTTITWQLDDICYTATLPTADTKPTITTC